MRPQGSEVSGHAITDHFVDVNKMVDLGSGSQREVDDLMLTRYTCKTFLERGIRPESLPTAEDARKVERLIASFEKKSLKKLDSVE